MSKFNKKRRHDQLPPSQVTVDSDMALKAVNDSNSLWTDKYTPRTLDQTAIQKKKRDEFSKLIQDPLTRILIMQGQSGSGKNTLINTFA